MDFDGYYNRQGQPITMQQWGELHASFAYRVLAQERAGPYIVSTVWIGLDHSFGLGGPPIIFETMVFPVGQDGVWDVGERDMRRYCTEAEATAGHREMVEVILATEGIGEDDA